MKMYKGAGILGVLLGLLVLAGCRYPGPDYSGWDLSAEVRDSLRFAEAHHYSVNYNFMVCADSLGIVPLPSDSDSLYLCRRDLVVVADYAVFPQDSIDSVYVKVARDQQTIGWLRERDLLGNVVPDDPISRFIRAFSGIPPFSFFCTVGLLTCFCLFRFRKGGNFPFVHVRDIDSPYPVCLCLLVGGAAVFYGSIQHFVPSTWVHYYFHPTLNPFALPVGMGCFVACVWGILLLFLSVCDEVCRRLSFVDAFTYLSGLCVVCVLFYLVFTWLTPCYVGYVLYAGYAGYALWSLCRGHRWTGYRCGVCGCEMESGQGICPHCGTMNR